MDETVRPTPNDDAAAFAEAVQEGVAAADGGQRVPYEMVRRWLLSWGTEGELPPPPCP